MAPPRVDPDTEKRRIQASLLRAVLVQHLQSVLKTLLNLAAVYSACYFQKVQLKSSPRVHTSTCVRDVDYTVGIKEKTEGLTSKLGSGLAQIRLSRVWNVTLREKQKGVKDTFNCFK